MVDRGVVEVAVLGEDNDEDEVKRGEGEVTVDDLGEGVFLPATDPVFTGVLVMVVCFLVGPVMVRSSSVTVRTVISPPVPFPCFFSS